MSSAHPPSPAATAADLNRAHPVVSVVIPAFNRRDSVLTLLADVYRQEGVTFEVIVVDDCSPDDTAEAIRRSYPATTVLKNEQNGGPAVSRNRGVQVARGEFIVGFDSDVTVPDPTLLRRTVETFRSHPEATGLAFRLLQPDGTTEDKARWWHPVPIATHAQKRFETHYFSGTGYAFRRQEMINAGLYPEILYMHYEEVVLAYRILDNGGSLFHAPDLPVLHHASPIAQRGRIHNFYKPRNQILWGLLCLPQLQLVTYLVPRLVYNAFDALRSGTFATYLEALASARELCRPVRRLRRPLQRRTSQRLRALKKQRQ